MVDGGWWMVKRASFHTIHHPPSTNVSAPRSGRRASRRRWRRARCRRRRPGGRSRAGGCGRKRVNPVFLAAGAMGSSSTSKSPATSCATGTATGTGLAWCRRCFFDDCFWGAAFGARVTAGVTTGAATAAATGRATAGGAVARLVSAGAVACAASSSFSTHVRNDCIFASASRSGDELGPRRPGTPGAPAPRARGRVALGGSLASIQLTICCRPSGTAGLNSLSGLGVSVAWRIIWLMMFVSGKGDWPATGGRGRSRGCRCRRGCRPRAGRACSGAM